MYIFKQILQYLNENYFSASLGTYDNFEIESAIAPVFIIGGLCLGVFLSSIIIVVQRKHVGKMARLLIAAEAKDKDSAKSLEELGLSKNALVKQSLSSASVLRKLLSVVDGEEVFTYYDELAAAYPDFKEEIEKGREELLKGGEEEKNTPALTEEKAEKKERSSFLKKRFRLKKLDFKTVKFFIAPELYERARIRFRDSGSGWWVVLLSFISMTVVFLLLLRFLPVLVSLFDVSLTNFKGI